jgi:hypothetical protein
VQTALDQFRENSGRARSLVGLASTLQAQTTPALDVSDIFRASFVLGVAALDHYVHEVARKGMLAIAAGTRPQTPAYLRFSVSLESVALYAGSPHASQWLEDEIRERHGWVSFQDPVKVADAIRLVCAKDLWSCVGLILKMPAGDAKLRLKLIVDRRNKIAHEADMNPTVPGSRWPIDAAAVEEALTFLEGVVGAIHQVVTGPQ